MESDLHLSLRLEKKEFVGSVGFKPCYLKSSYSLVGLQGSVIVPAMDS